MGADSPPIRMRCYVAAGTIFNHTRLAQKFTHFGASVRAMYPTPPPAAYAQDAYGFVGKSQQSTSMHVSANTHYYLFLNIFTFLLALTTQKTVLKRDLCNARKSQVH